MMLIGKIFQPRLVEFLHGLPVSDMQQITFDRTHVVPNEGLVIPAQVNYVAKGANLYAPDTNHMARFM